ncbi:hypothetical protein F2P81_016536 [Scophthalmus maximus]|uniref:Dendritic cell-specific transmembrane protein-like domain-containing protein n=1 Tax=Scophthalmus maximus TaxID=52904 RepID=A0A6A4SLG7_SCOMX|nr:hypothetical protein F2P81_016536 [Scophthalmus maximus]
MPYRDANTSPDTNPSRLQPPSRSQSEELVLAHLALRALCGGVSGTVLLLGIAHSLPLTFDLKLAAGGVFVGPVSNVERNVRAAALSVSCNLDLQVHHSRLLWQEAVRPFTRITQQLRDDKEGLESEALSVSRTFQSIRDEVVAQYGYSRFSPHRTASSNSTQERFTTKTMMQCDSVVDQGVQRCSDWFRRKWAECMEAIPVPVINHILCVSMKFHFLCDVMRVMTPWCREQLPVEGNFGQLFDQLNVSVDRLSRQFSTELVLQQQQQQPGLVGVVVDEQFTQSVTRSFQKLTTVMEKLLDVLQLLLSFTFISLFTSVMCFLCCVQGKRCLLPLTRSERRKFIDPGSLRIHPDEWRQVREKRRVLFLYNLQIQRRIFSMDRKRIITRGRGAEAVFQCVSRFGRHLCCRHGQDGSDSETHYDPG